MSTKLVVTGLDEPVYVDQRFTTVLRYVEKAEAANARVKLATEDGRIAVKAKDVVKIVEIGGIAEDEVGDEPAEEDTEKGPFDR